MKERTKVILTGDFNMPEINLGTFASGNTAVKDSYILLNIIFSFSLTQLVMEPTRIHGSNVKCSTLSLCRAS